eukprot:5235375-Pleurochrysis_carterae.AAC.2
MPQTSPNIRRRSPNIRRRSPNTVVRTSPNTNENAARRARWAAENTRQKIIGVFRETMQKAYKTATRCTTIVQVARSKRIVQVLKTMIGDKEKADDIYAVPDICTYENAPKQLPPRKTNNIPVTRRDRHCINSSHDAVKVVPHILSKVYAKAMNAGRVDAVGKARAFIIAGHLEEEVRGHQICIYVDIILSATEGTLYLSILDPNGNGYDTLTAELMNDRGHYLPLTIAQFAAANNLKYKVRPFAHNVNKGYFNGIQGILGGPFCVIYLLFMVYTLVKNDSRAVLRNIMNAKRPLDWIVEYRPITYLNRANHFTSNGRRKAATYDINAQKHLSANRLPNRYDLINEGGKLRDHIQRRIEEMVRLQPSLWPSIDRDSIRTGTVTAVATRDNPMNKSLRVNIMVAVLLFARDFLITCAAQKIRNGMQTALRRSETRRTSILSKSVRHVPTDRVPTHWRVRNKPLESRNSPRNGPRNGPRDSLRNRPKSKPKPKLAFTPRRSKIGFL